MTKNDPTKDPEFKRVLGNLLKSPPKRQAEMKVGKKTANSAQPKGPRGQRPSKDK